MSLWWNLELKDKLPETQPQRIIYPQYWVAGSKKKKGKNVCKGRLGQNTKENPRFDHCFMLHSELSYCNFE